MAEYIERKKIYADIGRFLIDKNSADFTNYEDGWTSAISKTMDMIMDAPAADVRPESHGHWAQQPLKSCFACSECSYCFEHEGYLAFFNYCPNCGAKMDGKEV